MPEKNRKIGYTYRLILRGFARYRKRFLLIIVFGFLAGLSEGVGIGALIPLFSLVANKGRIEEIDFVTRTIERLFSLLGFHLTPLFLIIFIVALFFIKSIIKFSTEYINGRTVVEFQEKTQKRLLKMTLESSWPHLLNQKTGHLATLLIYDIERAAQIFGVVSGLILLFTSFTMYALIAFGISTKFTLLTVGLGTIFFILLKPLFYKVKKISEETSSFQKKVSHQTGEAVGGAKIIKASAAERRVFEKTIDNFKRLRELKIRNLIYNNFGTALAEPTVLLIIIALFAISYRSPGFSIASFAVIIYLIRRMFSFIQSMQSHIQILSENSPYLINVLRYSKEASENKEIDRGTDTFSFNEALEFKNISFFYDSKRETLRDISFKINKGDMVGIIGPSGSGKTTVVDLILRLFEPQKGEILIDGKNISETRLNEWRGNIGYVPQDIFLVHDTIENNIKYFNDIPTEEVVRASKMANIYDTIQEFPLKFQTIVGERGIKLSGGQRQRIALARALARKPQILILDEATSAVDAESERLIQSAISGLRGQMTIFVIAHRLSTVLNSGQLLVLENGHIIEQGNPKDLLKTKDSHFYKIYNLKQI